MSTQAAIFGDYPESSKDVPACAVVIVVFTLLAVVNMTLLRTNLARGHKFIPQGAMFGLCMARITTFSLRLAYTKNPVNRNLAIAANIFLAAGVVILFILNILFSQRIFTSRHPSIAYVGSMFYKTLKIFYIFVILFLVTLIATTGAYYSVGPTVQSGIGTYRKVAMVFFTFSAFLPIIIVAAAYAISQSEQDKTWPVRQALWIEKYYGIYQSDPRKKPNALEFLSIADGETRPVVHVIPHPDRGAREVSLAIVIGPSVILTFATAVRASSNFVHATVAEKPWIDMRVTMYLCVAFAEILVEMLWIIGRVDLRFYIPDHVRYWADEGVVKEEGAETTADEYAENDSEKQRMRYPGEKDQNEV